MCHSGDTHDWIGSRLNGQRAGREAKMMECERLQTCPFFTGKMAKMPNSAGLFKQSYCLGGEKLDCARYQVAQAGMAVPPELFPNDLTWARQILQKR